MPSMEELRNQQWTQTIVPGMQEAMQPGNIPTGQQLVPGMTSQQQQAENLMQQGIGSYQPFLTAGGQSLATAMQTTGPQAMQAYMNPYTQDVVDATTTDLQRQFGIQQAQEAQRQIQSGGMRGAATRGAIADAELARTQGDTMANALARLRFGSADAAQQAAGQAAQTQTNIGQLYGGVLSPQAQAGLSGDVQGLWDIGEALRGIQAGQMEAKWQAPIRGLQQFANIMGGMPAAPAWQSPNPILTGIAAGGGIANLMGR